MRLSNKTLAALSLILLVAIWHGLAIFINDNTLPTPLVVLHVFWQEIESGQLPHHLGITLLRLLSSFSIAMLLGCAIGIVLGRNKKLDAFFDNWLIIFLNIPAIINRDPVSANFSREYSALLKLFFYSRSIVITRVFIKSSIRRNAVFF